jgi:hypothetical protein
VIEELSRVFVGKGRVIPKKLFLLLQEKLDDKKGQRLERLLKE